MKLYLIAFFVGVVMTLSGIYTERYQHTCPQHERIILQYPTIPELQEFLGVDPDGIFGPDTKQKYEAWSKEQEFNQNAIDTAGDLYDGQGEPK